MRKLILFLFLIISFLICVQVSTGDLTVHFLDVFGGDAVLLVGEGKTMLIDAGPSDSANLTRAYMKSLNIDHIDSVLITSPAEDRSGGMISVLNSTPPPEVFTGSWPGAQGSYLDFLNMLSSKQVSPKIVGQGEFIPFSDNISIQLVNQTNSPDSGSFTPLVPLITYGAIRFLLLGDNSDIPDNSSAEIIRVADHGSEQGTDSYGIHRIKPKIAVISTGFRVGEAPSPSTLSILENAGASILRTDLDGTVTIQTDGVGYSYGKKRMEPEMTISLVSVIETRPPGK